VKTSANQLYMENVTIKITNVFNAHQELMIEIVSTCSPTVRLPKVKEDANKRL